jgi:WD40 repeat protein
MKWVNLPKN